MSVSVAFFITCVNNEFNYIVRNILPQRINFEHRGIVSQYGIFFTREIRCPDYAMGAMMGHYGTRMAAALTNGTSISCYRVHDNGTTFSLLSSWTKEVVDLTEDDEEETVIAVPAPAIIDLTTEPEIEPDDALMELPEELPLLDFDAVMEINLDLFDDLDFDNIF